MANSRRVKTKGRWYHTWRRAKSAVTGEWVSPQYAARYPRLTMWITLRRKAQA
jgi:hypothetical protein